MMIRYKYIEHERTEDAPFIGALVCAIDCHNNCKNCFNQELRETPTQESEVNEIIKEIKDNKFNQGIILGGLEWTEQPQEMITLVNTALEEDLKVIVYTGMKEEEFKEKFSMLINSGVYIKVGRYIEELKCDDNIQYGIKLATKNQNIIKI